MATLHQLIPRELFVREDCYQQELEHVYKWSGISDQEIAEIYLTKLKKSGIKQHGASSVTTKKDPYAGFSDVPNFLDPTNNGKKEVMAILILIILPPTILYGFSLYAQGCRRLIN